MSCKFAPLNKFAVCRVLALKKREFPQCETCETQSQLQFTQTSEKYLNLQSSRFSSELNQRLSCEATSTKKVREKSHKETERKQKTIEKQKKKSGGGKEKFCYFPNKEGKTVAGCLFAFKPSEHFWRILTQIHFILKNRCSALISLERHAAALPTPTEGESCSCPTVTLLFFCHDSIIEGHSFTITVGL